jgi:predicted adenylyl cyclase CyaB
MPRNVEVKIRIDDLEVTRTRALDLGAADHGLIHQTDVYFETPRDRGVRLKLRRQQPGQAQLIVYRRPDVAGLRASDFRIVAVSDPAGLEHALALAFGVTRTVTTTRHLLLLARTRIHLDRVAGLGDFLELEVVLADGDGDEGGEQEAERILRDLGLADRPRLPGSYVDL